MTRRWVGRGAPSTVVLLAALALSPGGAYATALSAQDAQDAAGTRQVRVPDVRGNDLGTATLILRRAGIGVALVDSLPSRGERGVVLVQTPPPGPLVATEVAETLWVARPAREGETTLEDLMRQSRLAVRDVSLLDALRRRLAESPGQPVAPDVTGLPLDSARTAFRRIGLQVARIEEAASGERPGVVIRQLPPAGRVVGPSTEGVLWISTGPPPEEDRAVTPDVVGRSLPLAGRLMAEADLRVVRVDTLASAQPVGTVVRQLPAGGAPPPDDGAVALWISSGPPQEPEEPPEDDPGGGEVPEVLVPVPDVRTLDLGDAMRLLEGGELRLTRLDSAETDLPAGRVVEQLPPPGERVPSGSGVELTVSLGPSEVMVPAPDLQGLTLAQAERIASSVGLVAAPGDPAATAADATVTAQTPPPGTPLPTGTSVTLVLAAPVDTGLRWSDPRGWILGGLTALFVLLGPRRLLVSAPAGAGRFLRRMWRGGRDARNVAPAGSRLRFHPVPAPPRAELSWEGSRLWKHTVGLVGRPGAGTTTFRQSGEGPPGGGDG